MTNYPVGDFLTRIRNAALARRHEVVVDTTNLIRLTAKALERAGFVQDVKEVKGKLALAICYRRKKPIMLGIKLVSRPGLRIYASADDIEKKKGPATFLVSTPKGVLISKEVIKQRAGGEVLAEIW